MQSIEKSHLGPMMVLVLVPVYFGAMAATLRSQTVTTLATFQGTNGVDPLAPLVQGIDGDFYGTTAGGYHGPTYYAATAFQVSPNGTLTTLASLGIGHPLAGLLQPKNGGRWPPEGTSRLPVSVCGNGSCHPSDELRGSWKL